MLVRKMVNWMESKVEGRHKNLKAAGFGFVAGMIDGFAIMGPILMFSTYYWRKKATRRKK